MKRLVIAFAAILICGNALGQTSRRAPQQISVGDNSPNLSNIGGYVDITYNINIFINCKHNGEDYSNCERAISRTINSIPGVFQSNPYLPIPAGGRSNPFDEYHLLFAGLDAKAYGVDTPIGISQWGTSPEIPISLTNGSFTGSEVSLSTIGISDGFTAWKLQSSATSFSESQFQTISNVEHGFYGLKTPNPLDFGTQMLQLIAEQGRASLTQLSNPAGAAVANGIPSWYVPSLAASSETKNPFALDDNQNSSISSPGNMLTIHILGGSELPVINTGSSWCLTNTLTVRQPVDKNQNVGNSDQVTSVCPTTLPSPKGNVLSPTDAFMLLPQI